MSLFARSKHNLEAMAVEFLPFDQQLHLVVADADMNLQVLQFDPDNPKSEAGSRLLHKSTFHTGHFPTSLHLVQSHLALPSTTDTFTQDPLNNDNNDDEDNDDDNDNENATPAATKPSHTKHPLLHQILHTSQSGTLALITPLTEDSYRRLSNLASFLASTLDSPASLNPRAFRSPAADHSINGITTSEGGWDAGTGARGVLDGNLLMRWGELGERGRREGLGKYGEGSEGEWMFWGEREVLAGWGVFGGRGR